MSKHKKPILVAVGMVAFVLTISFSLLIFVHIRSTQGQVNGAGQGVQVGVDATIGMITYDPGTSIMTAGEQDSIAVKVNIGTLLVDGFQVFADISGTIPGDISFSANDLSGLGLREVAAELIEGDTGKLLRILFITADPQTPLQFGQDIVLGSLTFTVPTVGQMQITTDPLLTKIIDNSSGTNIAQIPGVQGYTFQSAGASLPRVTLDYDGDGKSDIGIFANTSAGWYIQHSGKSSSVAPYIRFFGWNGVKPITNGDYDGDKKDDIAIYDPIGSRWYIQYSSSSANAAPYYRAFGWTGVNALRGGDYDGDSKTDIAIYDPIGSRWYIQYSSLPANAAPYYRAFGWTGVTAVTDGDYDGDGKTDVAIYDRGGSRWYIQYSSRAANAAPYYRAFGWTGVMPIMGGDYDADGKTDIAIYEQASGSWFIQLSGSDEKSAPMYRKLGGPNTLPLMGGDYDGDGTTDIGVYNTFNSTWEFLYSSLGFDGSVTRKGFGWRGVTALGV